MKDGVVLSGLKIKYKNMKYKIGDVYFLPGNTEFYVQLMKDGENLNVPLKDITSSVLLTKKTL
jgi:hypothetical protein